MYLPCTTNWPFSSHLVKTHLGEMILNYCLCYRSTGVCHIVHCSHPQPPGLSPYKNPSHQALLLRFQCSIELTMPCRERPRPSLLTSLTPLFHTCIWIQRLREIKRARKSTRNGVRHKLIKKNNTVFFSFVTLTTRQKRDGRANGQGQNGFNSWIVVYRGLHFS